MRSARLSLFLALLVLGGCKTTEKPSLDRDAPATPASRTKAKGKGPTWLEDMNANLPGGGGVPKADSWADPLDPNTDITKEVRGLLAGVVVDPDGHRASNVTIQIEPANAPAAGPVPPAPMSIASDQQGYFLTKGLKPGQSYTLTVRAMMEGRPLVAIQQTRVPNPNLTIKLRDDVNPSSLPPAASSPGAIPPGTVQGFPPPAMPSSPPSSRGPEFPPPPADLDSSGAAISRPSDTGWSPGGASTAPLHKIAPPTAVTPTPTARPVKPENQAADPRPDWKPPAASLPSPALPALPPPISPIAPTPTPADPNRMRSSSTKAAAGIALVDSLNRPWTFESRSGKLVLLDFMTTTCGPCKKSLPSLIALQSRYGAYGLQVVGVACDEKPLDERAALAAKYVRDFNLNYALYVEPGAEPGRVRDRLNVEKYPTAILLDDLGREVWRGHPSDAAKLEAAVRQQLAAH